MRAIWQTIPLQLGTLLAACAAWSGPVQFQRETIALPEHAQYRFVKLRGEGRFDLLAVDVKENKLLIHRQSASGFNPVPDQTIQLPAQTAWLCAADVDPSPGVELLMSTATGLFYFRQNDGVFETEPRALLKANQVFTNSTIRFLTALGHAADGTNDVLPVISAGQARLYQRNSAYQWNAAPPATLPRRQTLWSVGRDDWQLGANPSFELSVQEVFRAKPDEAPDAAQKAESDFIHHFLKPTRQESFWEQDGEQRLDVNGDGREDVVLWHVTGNKDVRTDLHIFLRGADQQLPRQPSVVMRCNGRPIAGGPRQSYSPFYNLKGDGRYELVLLALKTAETSYSSLVDSLISGSTEWELSIRTWHDGAFSRAADASISVSTMLSLMDAPGVLLAADFNGDRRPDLLVKRSDTQWNLLLSATDESWFTPRPAAAFEIPHGSYFYDTDLNGDGRADLVAETDDPPRLLIYLSQSPADERSRP